MRRTMLFLLAMMATVFLFSCKKEIPEEQVRKDVTLYYSNINAGSTASLDCSSSVDAMEIMEKLSKEDKVELKVRVDITRTCVRSKDQSLAAQIAQGAESFTKLGPGKKFFQQCLQMSYEIFDEGFKMRRFEFDDNCPESESFQMNKKARLENLLKETALAACTCKHTNCAEQAIMDLCSLDKEADINGDGINEILVNDNCQGNGPVCVSYLWSIVDNQPRRILGDSINFDKVAKRSDGRYPDVETSTLWGTDTTYTLHYFDDRIGSYVATNKKRIVRNLAIHFSGGPVGTEIYIDGRYIGSLEQSKEFSDQGSFEARNLPNKILKIELRKSGYKTSFTDWDWDNLPHVAEGGFLGFGLEKE